MRQQDDGVRQDCNRIGHCMAKSVSLAVQQDCRGGIMPPDLFLHRCWYLAKPETADKRIRIPRGKPEAIIASAVPRPFRSGRCSSCAFSARAATARIRVSIPIMIVKVARSFRCAVIGYFLFTKVNRNYLAFFYFNPVIPTNIAPFFEKYQTSGNC